MKKIIVLLVIGLFGVNKPIQSQIDVGLRLGIHSFDLSNPLDIVLPDNESIKFKDAKLGFQGGIYSRFTLGAIYIEPRLMLSTTSVEYTFNGDNGGLVDNLVSESFTNLDIPLVLGFNVLFFNIYTGPVAHINLNSSSDLFDFSEYKERFKTATYGFRLGTCFSLGTIELSVEYEGNFSEFGEHINIGNQSYSFDDKPSRLLFNVGIPIF